MFNVQNLQITVRHSCALIRELANEQYDCLGRTFAVREGNIGYE